MHATPAEDALVLNIGQVAFAAPLALQSTAYTLPPGALYTVGLVGAVGKAEGTLGSNAHPCGTSKLSMTDDGKVMVLDACINVKAA